MRLSPTSVLKYETCPQQYDLEEVRRIRPMHTAANLIFGRVVHRVVEQALRQAFAGQPFDAGAAFAADWQTARAQGGIDYSATQSPDSLTETGQALVTQFTARWPTFGWLPALDGQNQPLLEQKLEVKVTAGLIYVGRFDLVACHVDGTLAALDVKTPSSATDPDWLAVADQLMGYQWLLDAHAGRLGLPPVDRLGLVELIKRKVSKTGKGPEVCAPITAPRRPASVLAAYRQKVLWVAEDIDRQRFPRRGLMAHHSPCAMCAVKGLCQHDDPDGLIVPERPANAPRQAA
ncbi:MAG: PD-(D/E)XK nuclease family protein [Gammaproteobacteria bacterium]|nr:PD-(D/E)XK nuclease family protein [Gammaproteobacteria bacterium]